MQPSKTYSIKTKQFRFHLRDLKYDYDINQGFNSGDAIFKNMPNSEVFNKTNRYEILFLINVLQAHWNLSLQDCNKIERMIKTTMFETTFSQIDVADWLVLNWNQEILLNKTA